MYQNYVLVLPLKKLHFLPPREDCVSFVSHVRELKPTPRENHKGLVNKYFFYNLMLKNVLGRNNLQIIKNLLEFKVYGLKIFFFNGLGLSIK